MSIRVSAGDLGPGDAEADSEVDPVSRKGVSEVDPNAVRTGEPAAATDEGGLVVPWFADP